MPFSRGGTFGGRNRSDTDGLAISLPLASSVMTRHADNDILGSRAPTSSHFPRRTAGRTPVAIVGHAAPGRWTPASVPSHSSTPLQHQHFHEPLTLAHHAINVGDMSGGIRSSNGGGNRGGNNDNAGPPISGESADDESRKLGVLGMVALGFFWVSGGMYGNESLMLAAPPGIVFLSLLLVPLLFSLPISLLCAEMATAIPEDGGVIVWTTRACGPTIGYHNAFWVWVCWIIDSAVYPVLAAGYIDAAFPGQNYWVAQGGALGIVVLVTCIKLAGLNAIVKFSTVLTLLTILPCAIFVCAGLPSLKPENWISFSDGGPATEWSLLVSWMLWLYSGFAGLGALAGMVRDGKRTFTISTGILLLLTMIINTMPLMVALSFDPDRSHYTAGFFGVVASKNVGSWMRWAFLVGSIVSMIGLYNSQVITAEMTLSYLVSELLPLWLDEREQAGGWLWSVRGNGGGTAPAFQLTNAALALGLCFLPYTLLIESSMLLGACSSLLFLISFVVLRVREPKLPRPFAVPGGIAVAVLMCIFPAGLTLANMYFDMVGSTPVMGVAFLRLYIFAGVVVFGVLVHISAKLVQCCRVAHMRRSHYSEYSPLLGSLDDDDDNKPIF